MKYGLNLIYFYLFLLKIGIAYIIVWKNILVIFDILFLYILGPHFAFRSGASNSRARIPGDGPGQFLGCHCEPRPDHMLIDWHIVLHFFYGFIVTYRTSFSFPLYAYRIIWHDIGFFNLCPPRMNATFCRFNINLHGYSTLSITAAEWILAHTSEWCAAQ